MLIINYELGVNLVMSKNNSEVIMAYFNITSKNVKFTIIDTEIDKLSEDDCFIEIQVQRGFLERVLRNLSMTSESTFDGDITLTKREKQVLSYICLGINNSQIAKKLNVSVHTAKLHVHNIFSKLSVQDRTEAAVKAIKYKLIEI